MVLYPTSRSGSRVLQLLESTEEYGGPQSLDDVCKSLGMANVNVRSLLSRLYIKGEIERIDKGIYKIKGDTREYNHNIVHYSE